MFLHLNLFSTKSAFHYVLLANTLTHLMYVQNVTLNVSFALELYLLNARLAQMDITWKGKLAQLIATIIIIWIAVAINV